MKKTILHSLKSGVYLILFLLIFLIGLIYILNKYTYKTFYNIFAVQSGSMQPHIPTTSLIVTSKNSSYKLGDVITFKNTSGIPTTHRIIEIKNSNNSISYITKGDANKSQDITSVKQSQIIGKVIFIAPYIGLLSIFTKTNLGFILLVIIPAFFIITSEFLTIRKELLLYIEKNIKHIKKVTFITKTYYISP